MLSVLLSIFAGTQSSKPLRAFVYSLLSTVAYILVIGPPPFLIENFRLDTQKVYFFSFLGLICLNLPAAFLGYHFKFFKARKSQKNKEDQFDIDL